MAKFISAVMAIALLESASAFAPQQNIVRPNTSLDASRRELFGEFAKVLGAGAIAVGASQVSGESSQLIAGLENPAMGNFRGKFKGQSFTPGKGMRNSEDELVAGLENPAMGNFRGKFKGQSFTPGKGMRYNEELVAGLENPAMGNFRGKFKGQSFTPGKGMRIREDIA